MVYTARQRCGRQLAIESPTDADVVSTVPESATPAALGYAEQVYLVCLLHLSNVIIYWVDLQSHQLFFCLLLTVWSSIH